MEANSGTWLEPQGSGIVSGSDEAFCILIEDSWEEKASGLQWMQVKRIIWGSSHQTVLRSNSKSISFQRRAD